MSAETDVAELNAALAAEIVAGLGASGVRAVIVSPGSRSTPLVLAVARSGLALRGVLDERVAAFFALGLARASGAPVALLCTSGSAGAHYLPAVIEAQASRLPLVLLTADRPPELHGCGAPQSVEQRALFGGFVKASADVGAPAVCREGWGAAISARLTALATASPQGPVHLNLPFREPLWSPAVTAPVVAPAPRFYTVEAQVDQAEMARLAGALTGRRGVILAGACGPQPGLAAAADALADVAGWPILAEAASQLRFRPGAVGRTVTAYDRLLADPTFVAAHAPEVIVRLGRAPMSRIVGRWASAPGPLNLLAGAELGEPADPDHRVDRFLCGPPAATLDALASALRALSVPPAPGWRSSWLDAEAAGDRASGHFTERVIARIVTDALPEGAGLHLANSSPIREVDAAAPASERSIAVFASRGANGIDGTIATALGEAAAWAGPTMLLCGDLAFLHDAGALIAASSGDLLAAGGLTIVVVNNRGGRIFERLPIAAHPEVERLFVMPQRVDLGAIACAAGARFVAVDDADALAEAVVGELGRPGIGVIEARPITGDSTSRLSLRR